MSKRVDRVQDLFDRFVEALHTELGYDEINSKTLEVVRQFLKDQGISANVGSHGPLRSVVEDLPFQEVS